MSDKETIKKRLKAVKKDLLEQKHNAEIEIDENKKTLRRTKRKIKQVEEMLKEI